MTLEELARAASTCATLENWQECKHTECPLFKVNNCTKLLLEHAASCFRACHKRFRLSNGIQQQAPEQLPLSNDLIWGILGNYKKPFVSIAINISEDET